MQTQALFHRIINHLLKPEQHELKSALWLPAFGGTVLKTGDK